MYCKHCNVNVDTAYDECPLCKGRLEGEPSQYPPFPERRPRKNKKPPTAKNVYATVTFPILVVCIVLNIVLQHTYIWALFAAIVILYGYFTITTTLFYKGPGGAKIFSQSLMLTVMCISAQYIFKTSEWAFAYAAPVLNIVSVATHLILVGAFHRKKGNQFMRYMWLTALIGLLPAIMVAAGICTWPYLAYASLALSAVTVVALLAFTRRTIAEEVKKKSHI